MKKTIIDWKTILVLIFLFLFAFSFSYKALWLGDDITYGYSYVDGSVVTSFTQAVQSQIAHYFSNNGRTPAHLLCQMFIPIWGKTAFAVTNGAVYVLLLIFMACLCGIRMDEPGKMAILACLIVLGFRTKFTPTCQIGFPWMFCLVTGYLILLKKYEKTQSRPLSSWHLIWAVPFALIAGWSQEALVIGVGVALVLMVLPNLKRVSFQQWTLLIAFAIGASLLCLSPATIGRTGETHGASNFLPAAVMSIAKLGFYLRITYFLIALVLYLLIAKKAKVRELYFEAPFWWHVWAVMLLFNIVIGVYGNRQLFGMELAAMVISMKYIMRYITSERVQHSIVVVLAVLVCIVCVSNSRFLSHHWDIYNEIVADYAVSEDGKVYHDFSSDDVTFIETYPSDVFSWYAMNTMARKFGPAKPLEIIPEVCRDLKTGNYWLKTAEGTLAVVVDKNNPPEKVEITRSLLHHRIASQTVSLAEPVYENDNCKVVLVYEKLPLVKYEEVLFDGYSETLPLDNTDLTNNGTAVPAII